MSLGSLLVEYTTLSIFFSILLTLALLRKEVVFKGYFESNTIVLLAEEIEVHLAIFE